MRAKRRLLCFTNMATGTSWSRIKREGGTGYQLPASKLERELLARNVPEQVFTLLASAK